MFHDYLPAWLLHAIIQRRFADVCYEADSVCNIWAKIARLLKLVPLRCTGCGAGLMWLCWKDLRMGRIETSSSSTNTNAQITPENLQDGHTLSSRLDFSIRYMLVFVLQWLSPTSWPVHHGTGKGPEDMHSFVQKMLSEHQIKAAPWNPLLFAGSKFKLAWLTGLNNYFCELSAKTKGLCSTVRMHSSRSVSYWIHKRSALSRGTVVWISAANDADNHWEEVFAINY